MQKLVHVDAATTQAAVRGQRGELRRADGPAAAGAGGVAAAARRLQEQRKTVSLCTIIIIIISPCNACLQVNLYPHVHAVQAISWSNFLPVCSAILNARYCTRNCREAENIIK